MSRSRLLPIVAVVCFSISTVVSAAEEFRLKSGDRVVLLGDALIEQEQYFGWIELALTTAFADQDVTFRNIGWSADTPAGASRFGLSLLQAGREPADEGWKQLQGQLELTRPSVLILGYGMASSLEGGAAGLSAFVKDYRALLDFARQVSPDVRFVFLTPIAHLGAGPERSAVLESYAKAIEGLASEYASPIVRLLEVADDMELRKDPIHLNAAGYRAVAQAVEAGLGISGANWSTGPQAARLRELILRKNEWWFHRSRPANMAYVFGFRKREQGQNAVEIPQFDTLILQEEQRIAAIRSLEPVSVPKAEPRLESKYAEFQEQARPEFTIDDEWEITLWAENPLLNKPIHMNFDPQGRLWVASSEAYPMIEVGQAAPDRILVLEDTDQDGRADKSTVFADGLLIPTGIAPGDGGVYVAQSTDLLFLQDQDGDGKADSKTRVLSGFGTEDTHHNLHTLRWGPDGRLYMNQSVYTRTDMETPHGVVRLKAGGGFRLNTGTLQAEVFFRGLWNSWGHQFDRYGQSFLSDGAGFDGLAYTFPGATFNPVPGARHLLGLISPGRWPKFASLEIIDGPSYPKDWQGSIVTCDFRANRVTRFSLAEQDAGFVTKQEDDLVRTSAATFRPIDVKQGPDGALYVADWSNPIINHGEVDFRDPRRDRWHGRIWRLQWKGAPRKQKRDWSSIETSQLLSILTSTQDRYDLEQIRRVLAERGSEAQAEIERWASGLSTAEQKLEALWLAQTHGNVDASALDELLAVNDPRIRAAAVRVLSSVGEPDLVPKPLVDQASALKLLGEKVADSHPRVRLEAVRGLGRHGSREAAELALNVLEYPMDRFIEHALALTVVELSEPIVAALSDGAWQDSGNEAKLEFVVNALEPEKASAFIKSRLAGQPLEANGRGPWIELVGQVGGAEELGQLLRQAARGEFQQDATVRVLRALANAQRIRRLQPVAGRPELVKLLQSSSQPVLVAAIELAGVWKMTGQLPLLKELVLEHRDDAVPGAAVRAISDIGGSNAAKILVEFVETLPKREDRIAAAIGLARVNQDAALDAFMELQAEELAEAELLALWRGMLNARGLGKKFATRLEKEKPSDLAVSTGLRAVNDGGRNETELQAALKSLSKVEVQVYTPEFMRDLAQKASQGNPHRGELIYRRQELACVNCHAIGGVGGKVGPDMTSLGASAPLDYLVESVFAPNAKIKENYHALTVITEDDQIITGIESGSTDEELVLRDANDRLRRIPRAEIVGQKAAQSLMPVGVVDRLSQSEQADLISFLSQLGKPGPFDASQGGVARVYEVLAGTHRREQQGAEQIISGEYSEGWQRLETRVNGDVARDTLVEMTKQPINIALVHVYLRTNVELSADTEVKFHVPGSASLWIDGRSIDETTEEVSGEKTTTATEKLKAGQYQVLVRLDARDLPEVFHLTSTEVAFTGIEE